MRSHRVKGDAKKAYVARSRRPAVRYCACGCKGELPEAKKPSQIRYFLQGHDAKLKATAKKIADTGKGRLPAIALKNLARINFLKASPLAMAAGSSAQ